ncbi:MAG: hypothetical protein JWQ49_127 [Edaphobacter sp.]|nr:hypothetical protein [Edaphobacter sp.]
MPNIKGPDGKVIAFPAGTSDADIGLAFSSMPTPAVDMSKVAGAPATGMPQPATQVPANLQEAPAAGPGYVRSAYNASPLPIVKQIVTHPFKSANTVAAAIAPLPGEDWAANPIVKTIQGQVDNTVDNVKQAYQDGKKLDFTKSPITTLTSPAGVTVRRDLGRAVPMFGPVLAQAQEQHDAGNDAGMAGTLTGFVGSAALPDAIAGGVTKVRNLPSTLKTALQGPINEPIVPGGTLTPSARYANAKTLGVNLDAADATNNGFLKGVKTLNQNSLAGAGKYEALHNANVTALGDATDATLDQMHPGDRQSGGQTIQQALKADHQNLKTEADWNYKDLDRQVGAAPIDAAPLGKAAADILNQQAEYQKMFPSLTPPKTMGILRDVAKLGEPAAAVDELGNPTSTPPVQPTFAQLQALRSDLHGATMTNPDMIPGQGAAWLKQLTAATDNTMTGAESGLNPSQLAQFREANDYWSDAKNTYDNPSNPYYSAVRTDNPSSLYGGIGPKTVEGAKAMQKRLGGPESPAMGAVQRGTVEGALKTTNDGSPNFKTFGTQWNRVPSDYRNALFTPPQAEALNNIANTSNVLFKDSNPSGTAKVGQKIGEVTAPLSSAATTLALGHPLAAVGELGLAGLYGGAQHLIAKGMTSPAAVDWLMKPGAPLRPAIRANPFLPPAVIPVATRK